MEQSSLYKKQFYMTEEITLVLQKRMGKRFKEKSISMWQVHGIFHCYVLVILDVYVIGNSVIKNYFKGTHVNDPLSHHVM